MLARIRKAMDENESGFTLIELLVVMIIIGILAAIAIPVFLNQRKNAVDASMKSDLRTIANELESSYTDLEVYPASFAATTTPTVSGTVVKTSKNNSFTYTLSPGFAGPPAFTVGESYCIVATNAKGTHAWVYASALGGLQPSTVTACPAAY